MSTCLLIYFSLIVISCSFPTCMISKRIPNHFTTLNGSKNINDRSYKPTNSIKNSFSKDELSEKHKKNVSLMLFTAPILFAHLLIFPPQPSLAIDISPEQYSLQTMPLPRSKAFQSLPREDSRQIKSLLFPAPTKKEIQDLKDMQDKRLDICAERGVYWEQCFIFGDTGLDADSNTASSSLGRILNAKDSDSGANRKPPTW